jgi:hypothetical protein
VLIGQVLDELVYPVIAKPNFEGSSKGTSRTETAPIRREAGV